MQGAGADVTAAVGVLGAGGDDDACPADSLTPQGRSHLRADGSSSTTEGVEDSISPTIPFKK
jgi:hypothetical protein